MLCDFSHHEQDGALLSEQLVTLTGTRAAAMPS